MVLRDKLPSRSSSWISAISQALTTEPCHHSSWLHWINKAASPLSQQQQRSLHQAFSHLSVLTHLTSNRASSWSTQQPVIHWAQSQTTSASQTIKSPWMVANPSTPELNSYSSRTKELTKSSLKPPLSFRLRFTILFGKIAQMNYEPHRQQHQHPLNVS